jgi:hypothetical protein
MLECAIIEAAEPQLSAPKIQSANGGKRGLLCMEWSEMETSLRTEGKLSRSATEQQQLRHLVEPQRNPLAASTSRSRLDAGALADRHGRLVVDCGRSHSFLDLPGHGQECLLDIRCTLRGCLKEGDSKAVCKLLWQISASIPLVGTKRRRTLATVYSTTFLSAMSDLLPTRSLLTPSVA